MPGDKLLEFYNTLRSNPQIEGLPADYGQFKTTLQDETKAKAFFETIRQSKHVEGLPDNYDTFSTALGLKKKALSAPVQFGFETVPPAAPESPLLTSTSAGSSTLPSAPTGEILPGYTHAPKTNAEHLRNINAFAQQNVKVLQERVGILKRTREIQPQLDAISQQAEQIKGAIGGLPPDQHAATILQYNKLVEQGQALHSELEQSSKRYKQLINQQGTLQAATQVQERMRQKTLESGYSNMQNLVDKTLSGSLHAMAGIREFMDNLPLADPADPARGIATRETQHEIDQRVNDHMKQVADAMISQETPKNFEKLFEGDFSAKKLGYFVTSAVGSTAPTVIAGLATGGLGSMAVGTGMMYDESYQTFKDAGLNDKDAAAAATGMAIPLGLLESWGVSDIVKSIAGKKLVAESIAALLPELTAKQLSREEIFQVVKKQVLQKVKDFSLGLIKTAKKEPITEMEQALVSEGAKQAAEAHTGQDSNAGQTTGEYLATTTKDILEQGIGGLIGGTAFGSIGAIQKSLYNPSTYQLATSLKDPIHLEQFNHALLEEIRTGKITQHQADIAKENIKKIQELDVKIPDTIKDIDTRAHAAELISKKNEIEDRIAGKETTLVAPEKEQIRIINDQLKSIGEPKNEKSVTDKLPAEPAGSKNETAGADTGGNGTPEGTGTPPATGDFGAQVSPANPQGDHPGSVPTPEPHQEPPVNESKEETPQDLQTQGDTGTNNEPAKIPLTPVEKTEVQQAGFAEGQHFYNALKKYLPDEFAKYDGKPFSEIPVEVKDQLKAVRTKERKARQLKSKNNEAKELQADQHKEQIDVIPDKETGGPKTPTGETVQTKDRGGLKQTGRNTTYEEGRMAPASEDYVQTVNKNKVFYKEMNLFENADRAVAYLKDFGDDTHAAYEAMINTFASNPYEQPYNGVAGEILSDRLYKESVAARENGDTRASEKLLERSNLLREAVFYSYTKAGQYTAAASIFSRVTNPNAALLFTSEQVQKLVDQAPVSKKEKISQGAKDAIEAVNQDRKDAARESTIGIEKLLAQVKLGEAIGASKEAQKLEADLQKERAKIAELQAKEKLAQKDTADTERLKRVQAELKEAQKLEKDIAARIAKELNEKGLKLRNFVSKQLQAGQTAEQIAKELAQEYGIKPQEAKQLAGRVHAAYAKALSEKVYNTLIKQLGPKAVKKIDRMNNAGPLKPLDKTLGDQIVNEILAGSFNSESLTQAFQVKYGLPVITKAVAANITTLAQQAHAATTVTGRMQANRNMMTYIHQQMPANRWNVLTTAYYVSLLSGPTTAAVNATANLFQFFSYRIENKMQDVIETTQSLYDDKQKGAHANLVNIGGIPVRMQMSMNNLHQSLIPLADILARGGADSKWHNATAKSFARFDSEELIVKKKDFKGLLNFPKLLRTTAKIAYTPPALITRNLDAFDKSFQTAIFNVEATRLVRKQLRASGLKGDALETEVLKQIYGTYEIQQQALIDAQAEARQIGMDPDKYKLFVRRIQFELIQNNLDDQVQAAANEVARDNVFKGAPRGAAGYLGRVIPQWVLVTPFIHTTMNIAEKLVNYVPIYGILRYSGLSITDITRRYNSKAEASFKAKGIEHAKRTGALRNKQLAQVMTSHAVLLTLLGLSKLVWHDDEDDKDKPFVDISGGYLGMTTEARKRAEGEMPPFSIRIGAVKWNYKSNPMLAMAALPLSLQMDRDRTGRSDEKTSLIDLYYLQALLVFLIDATPVKNISEMFKNIREYTDPTQEVDMKTFGKNLLQPLLVSSSVLVEPNAYKQVVNLFDGTKFTTADLKEICWKAYNLERVGDLHPAYDHQGRVIEFFPGEQNFPYHWWAGTVGKNRVTNWLVSNNINVPFNSQRALVLDGNTATLTTPAKFVELVKNKDWKQIGNSFQIKRFIQAKYHKQGLRGEALEQATNSEVTSIAELKKRFDLSADEITPENLALQTSFNFRLLTDHEFMDMDQTVRQRVFKIVHENFDKVVSTETDIQGNPYVTVPFKDLNKADAEATLNFLFKAERMKYIGKEFGLHPELGETEFKPANKIPEE